jgi:hypothetical protein
MKLSIYISGPVTIDKKGEMEEKKHFTCAQYMTKNRIIVSHIQSFILLTPSIKSRLCLSYPVAKQ